MAKGENQKLKMLYLMKIFLKETDENNDLTLEQITDLLNGYGVNADRKTLYNDFEELRKYGMEIEKEQRERTFFYRLISRDFELAELKLLVDSVQAAKFITSKKSAELIGKIESLASRYQANQLNHQLYIADRPKSGNESIYINVDIINAAINDNKRIEFQYLEWNVKKRLVEKHGGGKYIVSPLALILDNENYYLIGYDVKAGIEKNFRVDKMKKLAILRDKREKRFSKKELVQYTQAHFGMFSGELKRVSIEAPNGLVGVFLDRFGKDAFIRQKDENSFCITVEVAFSQVFKGWLIGLGPEVVLTYPADAVDEMRVLAEQLRAKYCK